MKNLLLSFILLLNFSSYSQTLVFDQIFIKAHDVDLYDSYLKDHFSKVMGERVDNGSLFAWDVWKVIQNPQEDYTHMLTFIYDFDKEETSWKSPFSEIINDAVMKDISSIRDRIARTKLNNLAFVRKDGAPAVPEIMVANFMKVKNNLFASYEKAEINGTKKIDKDDIRVGWNFHRRLDDFGSDTYFSHVTIDWYDSYRDYLKSNMGDLPDYADSEWEKLRDLKKRVAFRKFISINNMK
tara:strand:- start:672 stop:1388 length:717 start_codon:yes stop_codon:yes gene_type:complete